MSGDRILLEGMRFFAHHGDVAAERELGSHLVVDVELRADLSRPASSDSLHDTVDYVHCYELVRQVVETRQFHLLEALADAIARALLDDARVESARVRVAKQPPIAGMIERFAVVIERSRTMS
ncbi:MAG: dihydroneopterin aldolase [Candidatus Dormibacteraeota bacterium]|nr:dihydroneopterin aldolase [Candidatus Dormibacteraeota bacterium]MBV8445377.1 dihydroneopterin aldolase [Candidatus Dormibacteraeota bacterium]